MGVSSCSSRSSVFLMADNHLTGFSVQQHSRHFRFWPGICLSKGNLSSPTLLLLPPTLLSLRDHFPFAQIERVVNKVRYRHDILTGMASNSFNSFPTVKSASHPRSLCNNSFSLLFTSSQKVCSQLLDSMTYLLLQSSTENKSNVKINFLPTRRRKLCSEAPSELGREQDNNL